MIYVLFGVGWAFSLAGMPVISLFLWGLGLFAAFDEDTDDL